MNAREEILGRIRQALTPDPGRPSTRTPAPAVPRGYRTTGDLTAAQTLDQLVDRLVDYHAQVHRCAPGDETTLVRGLLADRGVRRLVVPERAPVDLTGWDGELLVDHPTTPLPVADLDDADAVLTGCAIAVAQTGTLVLDAGPDQGRRAITLIPDHHLVVVHAHQIVQTVPEALPCLDPARPLTWISGPSATSDIELSRIEGVHGPRTLEVVLVGADA